MKSTVINTTVLSLYINFIYIYIATFCHGTSVKKTNIWPRGDSNITIYIINI